MKKIVLFLVFILCFPLIQSTQEETSAKQYFNIIKDGEYFIKVKVVPSFVKVISPSEIEEKKAVEEKDIAEEVRDEIESSEEKAIENINAIEAKVIEEIKAFGVGSIEKKYIEQIKALKEKKVSEIKAIRKELIEKIKGAKEKKVIEIREAEEKKAIEEREGTTEILLEKIIKRKKDIEKRTDEEMKSIEEKAKKEIEDIKVYRIPDIKYVEAWTIREINALKQKAIEEKRIIEKKYQEELKDLEKMAKELNLPKLQMEEKIPIFRISQKGEIDKKLENLWLISDLETKEIEEGFNYLENFELNFLPEKPLNFAIFPNFRVDYCIFGNKGKQYDLKFYFNIDSDKDGIADILAVTEENDLERDSPLGIQFGKDGFNRPFKSKNKRYLIERELGLKAEDNWYYDCVNASLKYDFQPKKVVIEANYEGKDFSDIMLRRRFYKLDLQKYPFLSVDYEVFDGEIPWVYLTLRIDTTGNGRPDKTIVSPWRREASGELILNTYGVAKKNFPRENAYFLVEATIHIAKKEVLENTGNNNSVIYLKKFSSFKYISPNFINSLERKEERKLVYIIPQKAEKIDKLSGCESIEIDLKSQITQVNKKDWAKYNILGGKIFIKDQEELNSIKNLKLLIKEAYFHPSKALLRLLDKREEIEKRKEIIKQKISEKKEKIDMEKTIEKKVIAEEMEKIKKEEAITKKDIADLVTFFSSFLSDLAKIATFFISAEEKGFIEDIEDKDIPNFLSKMAYPTLKYSSISDVLKERKLFFQEIGYKEQFNLSTFKAEESLESEDGNPIINNWQIINQNCNFTAKRKSNSVDFKIKFKGRSIKNSLLKLKKQISLNLNKFNILKTDVENIPLGGEIICKLFLKVEGKKQEISFRLEGAKEYDLLENFPEKKVILSEMILILKPTREISNQELDFKLKGLSFYSYKQGNILNYLKNTYVKGSQSKHSINIASDEVESGGVEYSDFYKDKKQNLVFIFHESETNKNQIKMKHFFEPVILIKEWKKFEFEYFTYNSENLEIAFRFLIDLFEDRKADKVVTYRPMLTDRKNKNANLASLHFSIFESINSFWRCYPEAQLKGVEIFIRKKEKANSFLKSMDGANLFLLSNLKLSRDEYEDTIYNEILTLLLVELDRKEYRLDQAEIFNDNMVIQAITEGQWFILGRALLKEGKHELKMLKHPWLKVEMVEIAE